MFLKLYLWSVIAFLAIDSIWLATMGARVYRKTLGHLLAAKPNLLAAGVFYAFYPVGLILLVTLPAVMRQTTLFQIFVLGSILGAMAYGTYDLTNLATLKGWTVFISIIDIIWGAMLTGSVACLSVWFARRY